MPKVFSKLSIGHRLFGLLALFAFGLIAIMSVESWTQYSSLKEQKFAELQHLTDAAISVMEDHQKMVSEGKMPLKDAQKRAFDIIQSMRYGDGNYFVIQSLDDKYSVLMHAGKPSLVGLCVGAIAGLATITPCAGFVRPWAAFVVGLLSAPFCYGCCELKNRFKWDDALDVWGVHGMGGALGSILVGVFSDPAITDGDPAWSGELLGKQAVATLIGLSSLSRTMEYFENTPMPGPIAAWRRSGSGIPAF